METTEPPGSRSAKRDDADDVNRYIATLDEKKRQGLAAAEESINLAILMHPHRERRAPEQLAVAKDSNLVTH